MYYLRSVYKPVTETLPEKDLHKILKGCRKNRRDDQVALYKLYYGYAMSIGLRYAQSRVEAEEIVNDGFLKLMQRLNQFDEALEFKPWLRRIMVNTAIDHYRRNHKHHHNLSIVDAHEVQVSEDVLDALSAEEIIACVQQLPPAYKLVFNLYAIEGFKHHEIATELGISEGTSKSNFAKARKKLQTMIHDNHGERKSYG